MEYGLVRDILEFAWKRGSDLPEVYFLSADLPRRLALLQAVDGQAALRFISKLHAFEATQLLGAVATGVRDAAPPRCPDAPPPPLDTVGPCQHLSEIRSRFLKVGRGSPSALAVRSPHAGIPLDIHASCPRQCSLSTTYASTLCPPSLTTGVQWSGHRDPSVILISIPNVRTSILPLFVFTAACEPTGRVRAAAALRVRLWHPRAGHGGRAPPPLG